MAKHRIYDMTFSSVYPLYIEKAKRKNRTKEEVDEIILWLTGYTINEIDMQIENSVTFEKFFKNAPLLNPNRLFITGTICGVKIEEIEDELMKEIRYLDKLIDELAKGKSMDKILRQ